MKNFMHKISWISILGAIIFVLYYAFCMLYPYKTIDIVEPIKIINPVVCQGEDVVYEVNYCKYTDKSAILSKILVDTCRLNLGGIRSNVPMGCHTSQTVVNLPKSVELSGEFYLDILTEYKVNPFRTITKNARTENFIIVE